MYDAFGFLPVTSQLQKFSNFYLKVTSLLKVGFVEVIFQLKQQVLRHTFERELSSFQKHSWTTNDTVIRCPRVFLKRWKFSLKRMPQYLLFELKNYLNKTHFQQTSDF